MKIRRLLILIIMMIISIPTCISQDNDQPEGIIRRYVESVKLLDLNGMLKCFAIDEYVNHFDYFKA